ncbi:unnamed protein product, partial [Porites evermanni]
MDERRRALVPVTVENSTVDDLFAGVRSPVLIRINSSCDITLIPAPAAQYVRPSIVNDSSLNEYFPPVELDECRCNCSSLTVFCLVAMVAETSECLASAATEDDSPVMSENECSPQDDDSENSDENTDSDPEEVEYFSETFSVKGSFWATR